MKRAMLSMAFMLASTVSFYACGGTETAEEVPGDSEQALDSGHCQVTSATDGHQTGMCFAGNYRQSGNCYKGYIGRSIFYAGTDAAGKAVYTDSVGCF